MFSFIIIAKIGNLLNCWRRKEGNQRRVDKIIIMYIISIDLVEEKSI